MFLMDREIIRFVVDIPKEDLEDIARLDEAEEELSGGFSPELLAGCLKRAILAGFEEYIGEEVNVSVKPVSTT